MATACILGLDTALGAYLARLLGARGYRVRGTGGPGLLERLGIADDVVIDAAPELAVDEVYDLRGNATATEALLASDTRARILVAVDPDDAASIAVLADLRVAGRFVVTARVYPNESRLGPGTSPVARIVAAVASGVAADPADLATASDCGWTAEYVDAIWRMLNQRTATDLAIATGRSVTGSDAERTASVYFGRPPPPLGSSGAAVLGDPEPAAAVLGWHAVTVGDELVTVLCEGSTNGRAMPQLAKRGPLA